MTTSYSFSTLRTVVSTKDGAESTNNERLGGRTEDLQHLGLRGYELVNTLQIVTGDFITIVDTLQKKNEED